MSYLESEKGGRKKLFQRDTDFAVAVHKHNSSRRNTTFTTCLTYLETYHTDTFRRIS